MDTDTSNLPQRNSSKAPSEALKRDKLIAEQIWRLMTHYWIADDSSEVRQAQIEDWLEDMAEFGPEIVRQACAEWRQTQTRRPAPAELRTIAVQIRRRQNPEPEPVYLPPPPTRMEDPVKRAEMARLAGELGRALRLRGEAEAGE